MLYLGNLFVTRSWDEPEWFLCGEDFRTPPTPRPIGRQTMQSPAGGIPPGNARRAMQDVLMLLYTAIFFGLAFFYVKACQKLR
jgi:hypothetical protein